MSGLKECKTCGKEIAKSATTCPSCGEKVKMSLFRKISWGIAVVVVLLTITGISFDDFKEGYESGKAVQSQNIVKEKQDSPSYSVVSNTITFADRWNKNCENIGLSKEFKISPQVSVGEVQDVFRFDREDVNTSVIGAINKKDQSVREIQIISAPDGTDHTALVIIAYWCLLIDTLSPELDVNGRFDVLRELGVYDLKKGQKFPKKSSAIRGNIKYDFTLVDVGAVILTAGNINDVVQLSEKGKTINSINQPQSTDSNFQQMEIKKYKNEILDFENRLSSFASRINLGKENASALIASGNVLENDIENIKNKALQMGNSEMRDEIYTLLGIQQKRANCMVRGLKGDSSAYAEGGSYYDEFQMKFAKFRDKY